MCRFQTGPTRRGAGRTWEPGVGGAQRWEAGGCRAAVGGSHPGGSWGSIPGALAQSPTLLSLREGAGGMLRFPRGSHSGAQRGQGLAHSHTAQRQSQPEPGSTEVWRVHTGPGQPCWLCSPPPSWQPPSCLSCLIPMPPSQAAPHARSCPHCSELKPLPGPVSVRPQTPPPWPLSSPHTLL